MLNQTNNIPNEFYNRIGDPNSELIKESIIFIRNKIPEFEYSAWVIRYYGQKELENKISYNKIPLNFSGRIDILNFYEKHLISFQYKKGQINTSETFKKENKIKNIGYENLLVAPCEVHTLTFNGYIYFIVSCYTDSSGGSGSGTWPSVPPSNTTPPTGSPYPSYPHNPGCDNPNGGCYIIPVNPESDIPVICDHTNNFHPDCIPFPFDGP